TSHQENFNSLEDKLSEKLLLFRDCEKVICRSDVSVGSRPLTSFLSDLKAEIVDWSLEGESRYMYSLKKKSKLHAEVSAILPSGEYNFDLPFSDEASVENALHALTLSLEMGLPVETALGRIGNVEPVSMRLEILQGIQGSLLINDAYNSDIGGLSAALDLMNQQDQQKEKVLILSDLLQSGLEDHELYKGIADLINQKGIDHFIGIGTSLMQHRGQFFEQSQFFQDTTEFLTRIDRTIFRNRTVLIKGSRKYGFEKITGELQLKTHQTLLEIDLNAMVSNLNFYRSLLEDGIKTMVMVKALSYGSGNVEIANLLQFHKVDYLAVAFIDEGVELRKSGIHIPIM
ncbi:MAG: alanine racemase, partial [Bacteroidales bacterium]|nr:alanine racemase [Bacteroidales bacterium]